MTWTVLIFARDDVSRGEIVEAQEEREKNGSDDAYYWPYKGGTVFCTALFVNSCYLKCLWELSGRGLLMQ